MTSIVGSRVLCLENGEWVKGLVEFYSPNRQSHFVLFDDAFESSPPNNNQNQTPLPSITEAFRIQAEDAKLKSNLYYNSNNFNLSERHFSDKKSTIVWYGKWFRNISTLLAEKKIIKLIRDDNLYCICRRCEEACSPFKKSAAKMIECSKCKEWYHLDCLLCIKKPFVDDACFHCVQEQQRRDNKGEENEGREEQARSTTLQNNNEHVGNWFSHYENPSVYLKRYGRCFFCWEFLEFYNSDSEVTGGEWIYTMRTFRKEIASPHMTSVLRDDCLDLRSGMAKMLKTTTEEKTPLETMTTSFGVFMKNENIPETFTARRKNPLLLLKQPPIETCSRVRDVDQHKHVIEYRRVMTQKTFLRYSDLDEGDGNNAEESRSLRLLSRRTGEMLNNKQQHQLTIGCRRKLRFGKSPIQGWGVFADEFISANDFVVEYKGELIDNQTAEERDLQYQASSTPDYMFRIDSSVICDATRKGSIARFINHSCEPNCRTQIITDKGVKKIVIYAARDLHPGEELCYDYKFAFEEDESKRIACRCGAKRCRGYMN